MFHEHFGLAAPPFAEAPDVSFFCPLHDQTNLLASLEFAFKRGFGIVKLLGEEGTGKTLISRVLVASLGAGAAVGTVDARAAGRLLPALCQAFGVSPEPDPLESLRQFVIGLNGQLALAVIDEAHRLEDADLRALSRIDSLFPDKRKPLQVLLLGQPSLDERLQSPDFQSLNHRILLSLATREMSEAEAKTYLRHRLASAGAGERAVMAEATLDALARNCGGNHRQANLLAEKALAAAAAAGEDLVLPIHQGGPGKAAKLSQGASSSSTVGRKPLWPWLLILLAAVGLAVFFWPKPPAPSVPAMPQPAPVVKAVEPEPVVTPPPDAPREEVKQPETVPEAPVVKPAVKPAEKSRPKAMPKPVLKPIAVPVTPAPEPAAPPAAAPVSTPVPVSTPAPEVDDSIAAKVGSGVYPGQKR